MQRISDMRQQRSERGVVSIFIVLFAAIFMVVITVSFLLVMMRDQQQATQYDLSQNAYDSAMSGVSDAERAVALCAATPSLAGCNQLTTGGCQTLGNIAGLGVTFSMAPDGNKEYPIQTTSGGSNDLNQAYTCVTVDTHPSDYQANVNEGVPLVIPLQANASVSQLNFSWQKATTSVTPSYPTSSATGLLNYTAWNQTPNNYPPVMQLQLLRLGSGGSVTLSDLDGQAAETALLYPQNGSLGTSSPSSINFSTDARQKPSSLQPVNCYHDAIKGDQCFATLKDGSNPMVSTSGPAALYLVMTPIYGNASITVGLNSGNYFENLQASVDSTGRANDLFRRVQARVDLVPHPTYPNAAVSLQGPLCKNFTVIPSGATNNGGATCAWR